MRKINEILTDIRETRNSLHLLEKELEEFQSACDHNFVEHHWSCAGYISLDAACTKCGYREWRLCCPECGTKSDDLSKCLNPECPTNRICEGE